MRGMFRWLQALVTMAILMAGAYWIAQIVGTLYDNYNSYGILTFIGLLMALLGFIGFAERAWERWKHSRQRRG